MEKEDWEMAVAQTFVDLVESFGGVLRQDAIRSLLNSCADLLRMEQSYLFEADEVGGYRCIGGTGSSALVASPKLVEIVRRCHVQHEPISTRIQALAVCAVPMPLGGDELDVVICTAQSDTRDFEVRIPIARAFVRAAGRLLEQSNRLEQNRKLAVQLQGALESRVVIEQAKGMLAERHGNDLVTAFQQLRKQSRDTGQPIGDVAKSVVNKHHA